MRWLQAAIAMAICFVTFLLLASSVPGTPSFVYHPFDKHACPFYPQSALVPCTLAENEGCNFCKEVDRFCTTITAADEIYVMDQLGLKYRLPEGRWCLPPRPATEHDCNLYTSVPLLMLTGDGKLKWGCMCTKPHLVINEGGYGDCTKVVACDPQLGGKLVHRDSGVEWSADATWDPLVFGICQCPEGYKYVEKPDGDKRCLTDACNPGVSIAEGRCNCPERTGDDQAGYKSWLEYNGTCIGDPCNPLGYTEGGKCKCRRGSEAVMDANVVGKWKCESLCGPANNPCGGRGECYIRADGKAGCWRCKSPYIQTSSCRCSDTPCEERCTCSAGNECANSCCSVLGRPAKCIPFPDMCIGSSLPDQDLDARYSCGPRVI